LVSHTLREGHRWRIFENRMLRRKFGPKREAGEICITRSFMIKSRRLRWAGHEARMGAMRS
jgi:hypothetical protein